MDDERGNSEGATNGERVASGSPNGYGRRVYLASSWRNAYQPGVLKALRDAGHEVYDFRNPTDGYPNPNPEARPFQWEECDPEWEAWSTAKYALTLYAHPVARQGFESDWGAMQWANTCVLLLPSGRSAHLEGGYFADREGKELHVLLTDRMEPELMYRMATAVHVNVDSLLLSLRHAVGFTLPMRGR